MESGNTGSKAGISKNTGSKPGVMKMLYQRLRDRAGLARIHVILMCLCAVLFVVAIVVPGFKDYEEHGQMVACAESLRVVNGALIIQLLDSGEAETLKAAEKELVKVLPGRDGYCPIGGTIYFRKKSNGVWEAVCGLHDPDKKERTRLNASYVLSRIGERIRAAQRSGGKYPQQVTVQLNGKKLVCRLVSEETKFRRGTSTTKGYEDEGTVAFYGLRGYGSFKKGGAGQKETASSGGGSTSSQSNSASSGDGSASLQESAASLQGNAASLQGSAASLQGSAGEVVYFSFADENNNATWKEDDGWTGSSYGDRY